MFVRSSQPQLALTTVPDAHPAEPHPTPVSVIFRLPRVQPSAEALPSLTTRAAACLHSAFDQPQPCPEGLRTSPFPSGTQGMLQIKVAEEPAAYCRSVLANGARAHEATGMTPLV